MQSKKGSVGRKSENPTSPKLSQLTVQIRAGKAGIFVQSYEGDTRVKLEIKEIAQQLDWDLYVWTITEGMVRVADGKRIGSSDEPTQNPMTMLSEFHKLPPKSILIAQDFHMLFNPTQPADPVLVRKLKDVLADAQTDNRTFIIVGCTFYLPPELQKEIALVEFKLPGRDLLRETVAGIAKSAGLPEPDNGQMEKLIDAASGLTTTEAADACSVSVVETQIPDVKLGLLVPEIVAREKASTVKKNGILEIIDTRLGIDDIAGLEVLKAWLNPQLGKHERVVGVEIRDSLPRTLVGKLSRKELVAEERAKAGG